MDGIVELILSALPGLEGWVSSVQVALSALPGAVEGFVSSVQVALSALPYAVEGFIDTARVTLTATPLGLGLPIWLYGLLGGGFLAWAWKELCA